MCSHAVQLISMLLYTAVSWAELSWAEHAVLLYILYYMSWRAAAWQYILHSTALHTTTIHCTTATTVINSDPSIIDILMHVVVDSRVVHLSRFLVKALTRVLCMFIKALDCRGPYFLLYWECQLYPLYWHWIVVEHTCPWLSRWHTVLQCTVYCSSIQYACSIE